MRWLTKLSSNSAGGSDAPGEDAIGEATESGTNAGSGTAQEGGKFGLPQWSFAGAFSGHPFWRQASDSGAASGQAALAGQNPRHDNNKGPLA
jgi:hypothetical protein